MLSNHNEDREKQKNDSAAAAAHLDSLLKASNSQLKQDSLSQNKPDTEKDKSSHPQ
jgi:hypothetical protein